jgi:tripeptide aminopeptidase
MKTKAEFLSRPYAAEAIERLVRYASIETTSDRHVETTPTTQTQWQLARLLVEELKGLGIKDVRLDDQCYLIATLPASPGLEKKPSIGLMAHIDTASDVSGANVKPRIIRNYDGKAVKLSEGYVLDPAEFSDLAEHAGDTIIVTDGTTLLGADDKAGVAEIMCAVHALLADPSIKHGPIEIIFTPDEETGKGMDRFPVKLIKSAACYTLDGGKAGEIEAECFNAYEVKLEFTGKVIHIGAARGKFANAVSMAASFVSMLPRSEAPESTDGWYGYYCPLEINGGLEKATLDVFLRDFSAEGMDKRIEAVKAIAKAVEAQYPLGSVKVEVIKQYLNMRQKLDEKPEVLERCLEATRKAGLEPEIRPIRGGTDGARLTELGIPTPNLFTGGYNYHSRFEWASASEMAATVDTVIELVKLWAS